MYVCVHILMVKNGTRGTGMKCILRMRSKEKTVGSKEKSQNGSRDSVYCVANAY